MTTAQRIPRPSRTYKNGVGKPVVKKCWDEVLEAYRWRVVFPPVNNDGCWITVPEIELGGKAESWCWRMNCRLSDAEAAQRKEAQ